MRRTDGVDRRRVLIALSPAGEAYLDEVRRAGTTWLGSRLAELGDDELARLGAALPGARTPPERGVVNARMAAAATPHVRRAAVPQLPALLRQPDRLVLRHVDAAIAAQSWLVLELTGSGTALGTVLAMQFLPTLLLAPVGGVLADRFEKRRLIMGTQTTAGAAGPRCSVSSRSPAWSNSGWSTSSPRVRHRHRARQPEPPDLRDGDGRPGRRMQRRHAQQRRRQRGPGRSGRRSAAW